MALMDEMSKPKLGLELGFYFHMREHKDTYSMPPIVAMMARKYVLYILGIVKPMLAVVVEKY